VRAVASLTLVVAASLLMTGLAHAAKPRHDRFERAIISAVNQQRAAHGVAKVHRSTRLARAADFHSWEMLDANYFAHSSRDGGSFDNRVRRFARHRAIGETLAWMSGCGRGSARRVVRMWMNSPGHRAVLLTSQYRRIGVGKRVGRLGSTRACVITADFGSRR
jgi:uncharacterized protein YkwD